MARAKGEFKMTGNEYQKLAMATLNPGLEKKDILINGVMGLCGEAGEAIDIVKKWLAQGHELEREKLLKELGDVAWYLAETATALETPLEDILQANLCSTPPSTRQCPRNHICMPSPTVFTRKTGCAVTASMAQATVMCQGGFAKYSV